jgi:hypothetical protein
VQQKGREGRLISCRIGLQYNLSFSGQAGWERGPPYPFSLKKNSVQQVTIIFRGTGMSGAQRKK